MNQRRNRLTRIAVTAATALAAVSCSPIVDGSETLASPQAQGRWRVRIEGINIVDKVVGDSIFYTTHDTVVASLRARVGDREVASEALTVYGDHDKGYFDAGLQLDFDVLPSDANDLNVSFLVLNKGDGQAQAVLNQISDFTAQQLNKYYPPTGGIPYWDYGNKFTQWVNGFFSCDGVGAQDRVQWPLTNGGLDDTRTYNYAYSASSHKCGASTYQVRYTINKL